MIGEQEDRGDAMGGREGFLRAFDSLLVMLLLLLPRLEGKSRYSE